MFGGLSLAQAGAEHAKKQTKVTTKISLNTGVSGRVKGKGKAYGANCRGPGRPIKIFDVSGGKGNHVLANTINSSGGGYFGYKKAESGTKYQAVAPKWPAYATKNVLCKRAVSKAFKAS